MSEYVYIESEEEAAERVHFLNGGSIPAIATLEEITQTTASVKIMRSYDYCHFEIALSSDQAMGIDQVNQLRKQAAILVDEAVRQYKIAKKKESSRESLEWSLERFLDEVERIKEKPKSEWTPEDAATMRSHESGEFWKSYHDNDYFYDDEDSEKDHHFSMLERFKNVRVSAA